MSDIKIFVSHRIEFDSENIPNELYYDVRCGAVDDRRENVVMPGDDTGENISGRRVSFGEFTVQYWAWKNVTADYYGLCHYRRYLAFAPGSWNVNHYNQIVDPFLDRFAAKRYGLLNASAMRQLIKSHDIIVNKNADVRLITVKDTPKNTVYEHWVDWDGIIIEKETLNLLLSLIETLRPDYLQAVREYFAGYKFRGYNCYILRRDLFHQLCEFQFDILFELEKRLDTTGYNKDMKRTPAFVGEILYGIFIHHLQKQNKYRIRELPLVFFEETGKTRSVFHAAARRCRLHSRKVYWILRNRILPEGTKRRESAKRFYYKARDLFKRA
jgi:hypothetical protein